MQVITKVRLFRSPYTIFYISEDFGALSNEQCYKSIGVKTGDCCDIQVDDEIPASHALKLKTSAYFLHIFVKVCLNSDVYRQNVVRYLNSLSGVNGTVFLKLILEPPDQEIIDYAWNERMLRLVWTKVEIEHAFSWLSTLGGAYSALGDYFEQCAEEAGRISVRQYRLSLMLGDESLAARSRLYAAISQAQKGNLHISRAIVRNIAEFAHITKDKRLLRMCQGVWAKLKHLKSLKKIASLKQGNNCDKNNGEEVSVSNSRMIMFQSVVDLQR